MAEWDICTNGQIGRQTDKQTYIRSEGRTKNVAYNDALQSYMIAKTISQG